jgi:hypothetical protein
LPSELPKFKVPMKYPATLLMSLLLFSGVVHAQTPQTKCPRNFEGKNLPAVKQNLKKRKGDTVAFDAEVISIEKGYNDKPYFRVKFASGDTVWIASMITGNHVRLGRKLRLLGYIDAVDTDDEIALKYNTEGIQVRVFAILDIESKNLQISDAFDKEAKEWLAGIIPKPNK